MQGQAGVELRGMSANVSAPHLRSVVLKPRYLLRPVSVGVLGAFVGSLLQLEGVGL